MISGIGEMLVNKRKEVKKKGVIVVPTTGPAAWSKQVLFHYSGP